MQGGGGGLACEGGGKAGLARTWGLASASGRDVEHSVDVRRASRQRLTAPRGHTCVRVAARRRAVMHYNYDYKKRTDAYYFC